MKKSDLRPVEWDCMGQCRKGWLLLLRPDGCAFVETEEHSIETTDYSLVKFTDRDPKPEKEFIEISEKTLAAFNRFWEVYPKRDGKKLGKAAALKTFIKEPKKHWPAIMIGVTNYRASGQLPKDSFRWLRDRCWEEWQTPAIKDLDTGSQDLTVGDLYE